MKNFMKRTSAFLLAMILTVSYIPPVYAEETATVPDVTVTESMEVKPEISEQTDEKPVLPESETTMDTTQKQTPSEKKEETTQTPKEAKETKYDTIKVFETTDIHGHITDISSYNEQTFEYRMAYFGGIVNKARANGETVLLLDGGDTYQGTPHSNKSFGAPLLAALDSMEYDAVALGNHEFDWDVTKYAADSKGTMAPYHIGSHHGDSDIPVLMSNLYDLNGNRVNFTQDYTIVQKGNYKVGIIGWSDDYSADIKADKIAPYKIDTDKSKLNALIEKVNKEADVVVILTHSNPVPIAESVDPTIVDLVAGGHTHRAVNGVATNGVAYMQGNCNLYGYSETTIQINPETKDVKVTTPTYVDIAPRNSDHSHLYESNNANMDPEVLSISKEAWEAIKGEMTEVLGSITTSLTRTSPINQETTATTAGNWLTELMLEITKEQHTIAAFANRGGIRTDLAIPEGSTSREISVADIYTISPFGNHILTYSVTGKQLAKQLETALTGLNPSIGWEGGYQASNLGDQFSGIKATYIPVEGGIKVLSIVTDDGQWIDVNDETKTYPVCVNEYSATLDGSVFKELTPLVPLENAPVDNLAIIDVLRSKKEASANKVPELSVNTKPNTVSVTTRIQEISDTLASLEKNGVKPSDKQVLFSLKKELTILETSTALTDELSTKVKEELSKLKNLVKTLPEDIVVLHTNDVHGAIHGYGKVAALKKQLEEEGNFVVLVDAGDFAQGDPTVNTTQGLNAIELMNLADYDVGALGNHEFDFGYENLKKLDQNAKFPLLAANVLYKNQLAFQDRFIVTSDAGTKIGFFGIDTPETATKAHPAKIKDVTFLGTKDAKEMFDCAQKQVDLLKKEGCDIIICLGHLGTDKESAGHGSLDLLKNVNGIDLLIDGHSHSTLEEVLEATGGTGKIGNTYLTSTGTKLKNIGKVTIKDKKVQKVESIITDELSIEPDPACKAKADEIQATIDKEYGTVIGKTEIELDGLKEHVRTQETNLGNLITDAMVWACNKENIPVDAAITNGGGIRASIPAGDITKKAINTVLPFGNELSIVEVTGAELLEALEVATSVTPEALGGFPHVAGIRFTVNTSVAFDKGEQYPGSTYHKPNSIKRVTIQSIGGREFQEKEVYRIATNDFLASGGDVYHVFKVATKNTNLGTALDEVVMSYVSEELKGVVTAEKYGAPHGNITITNKTPDVKPNPNPDTKPDPKPDTKPIPKPDAKPNVKPNVKPNAKPTAKPTTKPSTPKTGDTTPIFLWMSVLVLSAGAGYTTYRKKKK